MKNCKAYRLAAWESLRGHWTPAVLAALVYLLIGVAIVAMGSLNLIFPSFPAGISLAEPVLTLFLLIPLEVGIYNAFKVFFRSGDDNFISNMFKGTFSSYLKNLGSMLLYALIVFLATCLLFVPGIIMALAYAFVPFLLKDCPEAGFTEVLTISRNMMKGHKWQLFKLELSFIGWFLLGILTAGIGFFWILPYLYTAISAFYEDVKAEKNPETVME